jgi:ABC-2 type transport system ATP-binding protein
LKNVSFEIADGEIFGLIGKNGAGKTTLSKIIATLVQPTGGRVAVKGIDSVRDEVRVRSLIGLATAEERSFYWRLTCEQNLFFFARLYGMNDAAARRRIERIFTDLDLSNLAKRRFAELSSGNKQRLAVARALLAAPPVLLLDEPTRSLDPLAADSMRELILSLKGVSVLLTSHNLAEVEELCSRVAIISKGEIRAVDTPENLRSAHRQTQTVKVFAANLTEPELQKIAVEFPNNYSIIDKTDFFILEFNREPKDDLLGKIVSILSAKGAKILDIETERATLLDVLESYE